MSFPQHQRMLFNAPRKALLRRSGKATHPFARGRIWLVLLSVLVGVVSSIGGIPRPAFAGSVVACSSTSPNFCWEGGTVQHHPHIYLTFWGPKWTSDPDHEQIIVGLEAVFRHFAGRQYTNILTQYGDSPNNHDSTVQNDFDMPAIPAFDLSTPGANLNPLDVVGEVLKEWPNADPDNQFLVFPQEGTTYLQFNGKDFCGMHANNAAGVVFGLIKYASDDPGCNFVGSVVTAHPANLVNNMVWTAVHEVAEMATDPRPLPASPSWKTKGSSSLDPTEVADLCQTWLPDQNTPPITFVDYPDTYHFYLPYLWSNK